VADADGACPGAWDADRVERKEREMTTVPTPMPHSRLPRLLDVALVGLLVVLVGAATLILAHEWGTRWSPQHVVRGSGIEATQSRDVPRFAALEVTGASEVTVRVGPAQSVVVTADDNLIERITTDVERGTLVLGTTGSFTTVRPMTVEVTTPTLDAVALTGSGVLSVEDVNADQLAVRMPGSGVLTITGTTEQLDVTLAGSGDVRLEQLVARDVVALLSGSGRLQVHAARSLDAAVSGAGVIVYRGDPPVVMQEVSGVGSITRA
jgi:Putative auto-transporter adhesin, head GIN domain